MDQILELDKEVFLALNGHHSAWLDPLMAFLSTTAAWLPLYLLLIYLIVRSYGKESWMVLVAIAITIALADQTTSTLMKPFFARPRPSHDPALEGLVHVVNGYRGGRFGFASSHAANTFGIAALMWLVLKRYRPWTALLFLWALFVGYTRIYLGVHYPGDILAGAMVGILYAMLVFLLLTFVSKQMAQRHTLPPGG